MTTFDLTRTLRQIVPFTEAPAALLEELAQQAACQTFAQDSILFLQDGPCAGLWIIESGSVKIARLTSDGGEYIMHLLGPGDSFNEIAAFDGGPNPATVTALSLLTCWYIPCEVLRSQLESNAWLARSVTYFLAGRVRELIGQIEGLALYSVTARLARFLLRQAETPSLSGPGITRAAIAAHLATTPETISRLLTKLQDARAIRFDRHRIYIVNETLMRTIAGQVE